MTLIMALDQGTTSSRTVLVNAKGEIVGQSSAPLDCHYPQTGWVEQDPLQIWETQRMTMLDVMQKTNVIIEDVAGLGSQISVKLRLSGKKPLENHLLQQLFGNVDVPRQSVNNSKRRARNH